MIKNLLDACGASVAFFTVGYAFAFGGSDAESAEKTFIGSSNFFLMGVEDLGFWLFQYAFSAAAATIVAGTLAERCQMAAYLSYTVLLAGWVYPIVVHSVWSVNGFLSANSIDPLWGVGMIDYAGSGVVHRKYKYCRFVVAVGFSFLSTLVDRQYVAPSAVCD